MKIKENVKVDEKFHFKNSTEDDMFKKITSLDATKAGMKDIPAKIFPYDAIVRYFFYSQKLQLILSFTNGKEFFFN